MASVPLRSFALAKWIVSLVFCLVMLASYAQGPSVHLEEEIQSAPRSLDIFLTQMPTQENGDKLMGIIVDSLTRKPIFAASLSVPRLAISTKSDFEGKFQLSSGDLKTSDMMELSSEGFNSKSLAISNAKKAVYSQAHSATASEGDHDAEEKKLSFAPLRVIRKLLDTL